jgi:hypothetical protein
MKKNPEASKAIQNAYREVQYNEYSFRNRNGEWVKIDLTGKIKCPVINANVSHQVCSHLMDKETWPRGVDPNICKKCGCYINMSIKKFQTQKKTKRE